jgi:hypothetical protein
MKIINESSYANHTDENNQRNSSYANHIDENNQ